MSQEWHIAIDNQEQRRKVAMVEGRARRDDHAEADDEVEFSLTLYRDQASLNVPASTQGREFIARLTEILGRADAFRTPPLNAAAPGGMGHGGHAHRALGPPGRPRLPRGPEPARLPGNPGRRLSGVSPACSGHPCLTDWPAFSRYGLGHKFLPLAGPYTE